MATMLISVLTNGRGRLGPQKNAQKTDDEETNNVDTKKLITLINQTGGGGR